jgi:DNA-binding transcriptional MerR regulator
MFTIGDFARHARVSVRMLRHYDRIGLLPPARVDPATGYRYYRPGQLSRLHRIMALKDLGFTLQQVAEVLDAHVSAEELRGMLRLRRAELREQIAADTARLRRVEARLRTIEREGQPPAGPVRMVSLPPVRVAQLTGTAASFEPGAIAPVLRPLFADLAGRVAAAGLSVTGPALAYYADAGEGDTAGEGDGECDGGALVVHAALPVAVGDGSGGGHGFDVVDLPAVPQAATVTHHGSMDEVMGTVHALADWIDGNGYRSIGYHRERTLELSAAGEPVVTELQESVTAAVPP